MKRILSLLLLVLLAACVPPASEEEPSEEISTLPPFLEDCNSEQNDSLETASGIPGENRWEATDLRLCDEDEDYYQLEIPAQQWLSLEMTIDGSGSGGSDLDLIEVDEDDERIWASESSQPFERLAWYNPTGTPMTRWVRVEGYNGADDDYDLLVRVASWADTIDCDAEYPDEDPGDEDGPCNRIMQFPQMNSDDDGYRVQHQTHYSNLRREVSYLVRWATAEVRAEYPDTGPLGLFDMSQWDGDTPGRMVGQLRHPEGTHVDGNDIDIAYYATDGDNLGGYACSSHSSTFCTGPANLLDVERTTLLLARLMESPHVRVIGVDPEVAELVVPMAYDLEDEGLISEAARQKITYSHLAYGDGWPFHHHHLHFSWQWEDGFEGRSEVPDGCLLQEDLDPQVAPR